jgi:peptidoglycan/xylan/chitin deacetylase (PgdA/CDA1 family)
VRHDRSFALRRRGLVLAALVLAAGVAAALVLLNRGGGAAHTSAGPEPRSTATAPPAQPPRPPRTRPVQPAVLHLPAAPPERVLDVPILMYHRIDLHQPGLPPITLRLTVDPADFSAQMRWLVSHGFHTITQRQLFDALERGARLPPKPVLITFDDGYRDVLGKALPVLRRLHLRATAYVITGRISGGDSSFLTWGMLSRLDRGGVDIGSHTVSHVELPTLSDGQALAQLVRSRNDLERHLGHPVQWFSYPAGRHDARTVALVRRAGYVLAVTTDPGARQDARDPLELHRYEVLDTTGVAGLASLLGS